MSLAVLIIGSLHAIPPIVGAAVSKKKSGMMVGAAIGALIAIASGHPLFIVTDLIGVGLGIWLGDKILAGVPSDADAELEPSALKVPDKDALPGNLYYVRLKTPLGLIYKLGFTTMKSVEARLAYPGFGHEKYIDKVLFFSDFPDAGNMEATLHEFFARKAIFLRARDGDMPLFNNGQSELYVEDILKQDYTYTPEQAWGTMESIYRFRGTRSGGSGAEMEHELMLHRLAFDRDLAAPRPQPRTKKEKRLNAAAAEVMDRVRMIARTRRRAQLMAELRKIESAAAYKQASPQQSPIQSVAEEQNSAEVTGVPV